LIAVDPEYFRICAIVLASPGSAEHDLTICRALLEEARATQHQANQPELAWSTCALVLAWWVSIVFLLDRWASGRYSRRAPAPR